MTEADFAHKARMVKWESLRRDNSKEKREHVRQIVDKIFRQFILLHFMNMQQGT
jgi:hypothetical protein